MSTMSSSWPARLVALSTLTLATLPRPATAQAPAPRASTGGSAAVADTLQRIYQRFLDGLRLRDTTMYRDLLATNYVHVFGDTAAVTVGRAARIAWDRERSGTITDFHVARCDVQFYGDAAVGPCWYTHRGEDAGRSFDWTGVALVTFVRGPARQWQIAATRPSLAGGVPPQRR
jgi:hypothetical protein